MRNTWKRMGSFKVAEAVRTSRFDSASARLISGQDSLQKLRPAFVRTISSELSVDSLAARVCPVLLADHTVALFALASHVGSDQADALAQRVVQQGYTLAVPQRYILPAPMLLAIVRKQLTSPTAPARSGPVARRLKTDLAEAFHDMVQWGVKNGASDLHINIFTGEPESEVRFTIGGRYIAPERFTRIPTLTLADMLAVAWMEVRGGNGAVFEPGTEQQGRLLKYVDGVPVVLRWASLAADRGPSVCLRILPKAVLGPDLSLSSLGYLPYQLAAMDRAVKISGGAIIFAGNVGSGKSTALAALITDLPDYRKVITVEDPVEYLMPNAIQNTVSRDLDTAAHEVYAAKLRTLKRSAMSDVLLGEIRDIETGRAFMDLAGSGVSLYTTTHAPRALSVAERLASDFIGVSRDFLSSPGILKLLVYQALLPVLCPHCALPPAVWPEGRKNHLLQVYQGCIDGLRLRNIRGCSRCRNTQIPQQNGYAGRTVAAECVEPANLPDFLSSIRRADGLRYLLDHPDPPFRIDQDPDMASSAHHIALYKSLQGIIDPADIEAVFRPFSTGQKPRVYSVGSRASHTQG